MDCRRVQAALSEAAAGGEPEAKLARHLETCVSCGAELQRLRTVVLQLERQLEAELAVEVPAELAARVRQRLAEVPPSHGVSFVWAGAAGLALALVVAFALVVARSGVPIRAPEATSAEVEQPPAPVPRTADRETSVMVSTPPTEPTPAPPAPTQPDVLVPPGQEAAILVFHQRSRDGRLILSVKRSAKPLADSPRLHISPLNRPHSRWSRSKFLLSPRTSRFSVTGKGDSDAQVNEGTDRSLDSGNEPSPRRSRFAGARRDRGGIRMDTVEGAVAARLRTKGRTLRQVMSRVRKKLRAR